MGSIISLVRRIIVLARLRYRHYHSFSRNYTGIYPVQLGSYGYAQACCNLRSRQLRAVKAIDVWHNDDEENRILDQMEEIHKSLIHCNIVRFYECFKEEERRLLSCELVDGRELFDAIQAGREYTTNHVRHYMSGILSAVEYFHDKNIIHRSLSPQRFMLVSATFTVKLLNLYSATQLNDEGLNEEHSIGNAKYCAPEVNCLRPYGKPADVYSCGLMLYNLLSGIHLLHPDEPIQEAARHGEYGFGRCDWEGVVEHGKDLIVEMLQIRPDDRITATEALRHPFFTADDMINRDKSFVSPKLCRIFAEERLLELIPARNTYDTIRYLLNMDIAVNSHEL